jgi:hypothetical protein
MKHQPGWLAIGVAVLFAACMRTPLDKGEVSGGDLSGLGGSVGGASIGGAGGGSTTSTFGGTMSNGSATSSTATGTGGTGVSPAIVSFTASPMAILVGEDSTLSWTVIGAATLSIDPGVG